MGGCHSPGKRESVAESFFLIFYFLIYYCGINKFINFAAQTQTQIQPFIMIKIKQVLLRGFVAMGKSQLSVWGTVFDSSSRN